MRLKSLKGYRGYDTNGKALGAGPGGEFECSDARGGRILRDYPGGFEVVGAAHADAASAPGDSGESAPTAPEPLPAAAPVLDNPAPGAPRRKRKGRA